jgi:phosphoglycolate phosphatase
VPDHLVLFDVDGTLVDCAGAGRRSLERAFRRVFGLDGAAALTSRVRFEGKTDPAIVAEMARAAGVAGPDLGAQVAALQEAYLVALRDEMARPDPRRRTMPGIPALLDALGARGGVALGLVTGNIEAGARAKLEAFGLNPRFPAGGFGSDHADRTEIARIARERFERLAGGPIPPGRVTVVGDTEMDIACARANGFRAVAVESGWVSRERLTAAGPDALLETLEDTPRALAAVLAG